MTTKTMRLFLAVLVGGILLSSCQNQEKGTQDKEKKCCKPNSEQVIQKNKEVVLNFYQKMFGDKDLSAVDEYINPIYIQHNPNVADGAEAFKEAAKGWFEGAEKTTIDVQHIAAEGDLVFLHIKNTNPDGTLVSTIDIFRLENGKIVEHWDVHQAVPEKAANDHPMF